tara:strand:- start:325 stop:534 length:210 start_codon:yes stop_codon:yes gene_type:complete
MRYLIVLLVFLLAGCDSGSSTAIDYSTDTSEEARRGVTDQMIEQGADPTEAEAFTSELYKAQREWEKNK